MKIKVIASVAAVAIAVVALAFTTAKKPTSLVTKYIDETKVTTSQISSLVRDELNVADNWTGSAVSVGSTGSYLGAIDFNQNETLPGDNGVDGDLTMQEAIDAVRAQYNTSTHDFNNYTFQVGNATIHIYKKVSQ